MMFEHTHTIFYMRTNTRKSYKIELILSNLISHLPMAIISTFIVYSKLFYPHLKNIYMKRHLLSNDMQTQNFPFYTFSLSLSMSSLSNFMQSEKNPFY